MTDNLGQTPVDAPSFEHGRALLIGIASYPNVRPLPAVVAQDATEMKSVLSSSEFCGYRDEHVKLLLNGQATLGAIRRELQSLADNSDTGDTVIIYFSGHGVRTGEPGSEASALVPFDCDPTDIDNSTLGEAEFSSALARIQARRLLVFIDACHSGAAGSFKDHTVDPPLGFDEKSLDRLAQGAGRVLIASSRASETSVVLPGATNSLFTQHLVGALRGEARTHGDGLIRVFEVFNHVAERVRGALPGRQHPVLKASDVEDNFPIALERGGQKGAEISDLITPKTEIWRQLEDILADLYPAGPLEQDIWLRAGGDLARLRFPGTGRSNWFAALRTMRQGGGGDISRQSLIRAALEDFPRHPELLHLLKDS